jgi:heavy metal sensor kinase
VSGWPRPRRLRARLTAWYLSMLALVLAIFVVGTSWVMYTQLRAELVRYIVQDLDTIEGLITFDQYGHPYFREQHHDQTESRFVLDRYFEMIASDGSVLYRNERLGDTGLDGADPVSDSDDAISERVGRLQDGTRVMVVSRRHIFEGQPPVVMRLGYSMEPIRQRVYDWVVDTLVSMAAMLLVAGIAGYQLAKRVLVPIDQMARHVEQIGPDRLNERLPVDGVDEELAHLAQVFNQLLDRVETSFEQLRRFTSDASHELRTPLTAIRSVGEVGLQQASTPEQYRDVIGSMLEEVNRLTVLVDDLLNLARADRHAVPLRHVPVRMLGLVREVTGLVDVLIEDKSQHLEVTGDQNAVVEGDPVFLRQALINIVHNAVKYSPVGGTIRVDVRQSGDARSTDLGSGRVIVEVTDSGPGIAREHFSRLFDRFYRVEESRVRDTSTGGAGLGLSIARWAVEAHGGTIDLDSTLGQGSTFRITLPVAA